MLRRRELSHLDIFFDYRFCSPQMRFSGRSCRAGIHVRCRARSSSSLREYVRSVKRASESASGRFSPRRSRQAYDLYVIAGRLIHRHEHRCSRFGRQQVLIDPTDVNETAAIGLAPNAGKTAGRAGADNWRGSPKNFVLQTEPQIQEVRDSRTRT